MEDTIANERLKEILGYDQETGLFVWKVRTSNRVQVGDVAGCVEKARGYRVIRVDGVHYYAHRLAWFYIYGRWPEKDIDHINGDKNDNRISNLRDVDRTTNMENLRLVNRLTKTGRLGVTIDKSKYAAHIMTAGKRVHLGNYATVEEAHQAYLTAKRKMHKGNTL